MAAIENRDYTLILDKSGSMATADVNGRSRWDAARESTEAIAAKVHTLDPDGITVYPFSGSFKRYDNTTPDKVAQIFKEHEPMGSTALHLVLKDAFSNWASRKKAGNLKGGETILVVTDGTPDDSKAVAVAIRDVTKLMDDDSELAISFLQVGKDGAAAAYLKRLDNDLQSEGAKYDIVDTKTFEELEGMTLTDALTAAIED